MTAEPTGREHLTPVKITSTSATERAAFRRCRRMWLLNTVHRLEPDDGNPNLWFGTLYHGALEAYYRAVDPDRPTAEPDRTAAEEAALDEYQRLYDESIEPIKEHLGFAWAQGEPLFRDLGELGMEMLQAYLERERNEPIGDRIIAVEFRVNVPIRNAAGRKVGVLSVKADLVVEREGHVAVVDHKTAGRAASSAHLDIDDQLTAEVWSWWRETGDFPEEAIYNVSLKKAAHPPKVLKSGKLSKDKGQLTTYALYLETIHRLKLPEAEYTDFLDYLLEQEAEGNQFFQREATFRSEPQMAAFERDLFEEWRDMRAVAAHPERAYPNPSAFNCPGCPVRILCFAIQDDGDVEALAKAGYTVAEPRR